MLNIIFQRAKANDPKTVHVDCRYFFDTNFNNSWLESDLAKELFEKVDKVKYIGDGILQTESRKIVPEMLCTSTKAALCIYNRQDLIFNATQMGDNVFDILLKYIKDMNLTILTYRDLHLETVDFTKDYKPIDFDKNDFEAYWDHFDEWEEEIYND